MRRQWLFALVLALAGVQSALAQSWPTKTVRVIVPVTAGSAIDIIARTVSEQLAAQLGQPFVVENRTGAGGTIGAAFVAKSDPDGYTILIHSSAHVISPSTFPNLSYDTGRDFAGVTLLANVPLVLVRLGRQIPTIHDLVGTAKERPRTTNFATVGYGAAAHLTAERLRLSAGFEAQQIPFQGAPEAMTEVLAGRVDFFFSPTLPTLPLLQDGKLRALAVSSSRRAAALPDVPTTLEAGFPELQLRFLDRHVRADENAARHRGEAVSGDAQGGADAQRAGEIRAAGRRAARHDTRRVRQIHPERDRDERGAGESGRDQAELS